MQSLFKATLKPEAKLKSIVKAESVEEKEAILQISTIESMTEAIQSTGPLPILLQIDVDFRGLVDKQSRDELITLFTTACEKFSQAISERTKGKSIVAVATYGSDQQKHQNNRKRRAADDVI